MAPAADASLIEAEQERVASELQEAEALFRQNAKESLAVDWRSAIDEPRAFLIETAKAADRL